MSDVDNDGEEDLAVEEPKTVHVRVADRDIDVDLSSGDYVKLEGSGAFAYVKKDYASLAKQSSEGEEDKDLRPVKPRKAYNTIYVPILAIRFIGTSAFVDITASVNGQEVVEHAQYVRPVAYHAPAVMNAMGVLRGLAERGIPWTAVVIAYPPGKPVKVLYVKSIRAYYRRYKTSSGVKIMPEVRFLFTKEIVGGLKKKTGYLFDFIVFAVQQVQKPKAKARAEAEEEAVEEGEETGEEEGEEETETEAEAEEKPKTKKAKSVKYSGVREYRLPTSTPAIYFELGGGAGIGQEPNSELTPVGGSGSAEGYHYGQQEGQQPNFNYVREAVGKYVERQVEAGSIELEPENTPLEEYYAKSVETGTSRYVQRADTPDTSELRKMEGARKYVRGEA